MNPPGTIASGLELGRRNEVDFGEWSELIRRDRRATVFQHPSVLEAFACHERGADAVWWEVRRSDRRLVGGLPLLRRRRWGTIAVLSGPAGIYGGPVTDPACSQAETILAEAFYREAGARWVHREMVWARPEPPRGDWKGLQPLPTAVLEIDPERPFEHFLREVFPKNRRNEGNRSDRRGLHVAVEDHARSIAEFHPLYRERCREWGVAPVADGLLVAMVDSHPECFVFVARDAEDRLVGAHVVVDLGDELFAWVGTTARRKDVFPATVLVREEARWCHRQRYRRLNLGASAGRQGVADYKRLLGARDDARWIVRADRRPWRR